MKAKLKNKLILSTIAGSILIGCNGLAAANVVNINEDVISSNVDPNWIKIPGAEPKVTYTGTIEMSGKKKEVDKFVRKMNKDGSYVGGYNTPADKRFTPEERERHLLISSFAPGAETNLLGDDKSNYNVDAVVAVEGGTINITGKDLTTNLVYMTTPLSTSKYAKKDEKQDGKMNINLTGDLIAHNDDWDLYPRMDGFHYYHSSNLYSRGGISVNGNNELNIKANKLEARYLRNSDWHHGEGKAHVNIDVNEFDLNRMGRAAYTVDGKADEQWVVGKSSDDKGGMFQFYNTHVNINAKDMKIGGVRPGQKPVEADPTIDRIDIDAGNRGEINLHSTGNIFHDGEIRAIDGASVNVIADKDFTGRNAVAGYTENYRYGKYLKNGKYSEGLYYYRGDGDLPNEDVSTVDIKGSNVTMKVSHQAEEGGYNHVGFGYIGALAKGNLNIKADKDLKILNDWIGFEGKTPLAITVKVAAGGVANLQGENVIVDGTVALGNKTEAYEETIYNDKGKEIDWNYHRTGYLDGEYGTLNIKGYGKDKGSLIFGGEINAFNSDLNVSDFKNVTVAIITGLWNGDYRGPQLKFNNIGTITFDATNQWHLDNHVDENGKPLVSSPIHGKGYAIINSTAAGRAHNLLQVNAENIIANGIMTGKNNFTLDLASKNSDLYRIYLYNGALGKITGENINFKTEALVKGNGSELNIEGKNITFSGNPYYTNEARPILNDNIYERGNLGTFTVAGGAKGTIKVLAGGELQGRVLDNVIYKSHPANTALTPEADVEWNSYNSPYDDEVYGHGTVELGENAKWSYSGDSVVENLISNNGIVDLAGNNEVNDTLTVKKLTGETTFKINAKADANRSRRAASIPWVNGDKVKINTVEGEDKTIKVAVAVTNPQDVEGIQNKKLLEIEQPSPDIKVVGALVNNNDELFAYTPEIKTEMDNTSLVLLLDKMVVEGPSTNGQSSNQALVGGYLATMGNNFNSIWQRGQQLSQGTPAGIWIDHSHAKQGIGSVNTEIKAHTVGYDKLVNTNNGKKYYGVAITNRRGDGDFQAGTSKIMNNTLSIYGGVENKGLYTNAWVTAGHLRNDYVTNADDQGHVRGNAWTIGGEIGKEFAGKNGFYMTPQLGLAVGNFSVDNFTTKQGLEVATTGITSKLARLGLTVGKRMEGKNIYANLAVLREFSKDLDYTIADKNGNNLAGKEAIKGTWYQVGAGMDYKISNKFNFQGGVYKILGGHMNSAWGGNMEFNYKF